MKRQDLKDLTQLFYKPNAYEKKMRHCVYDWLCNKPQTTRCEWSHVESNMPSLLQKVGPSSFVHSGNEPTYDITGCGVQHPMNLPMHNYYYEVSTSCVKYIPPVRTEKIFLKSRFPQLIGLNQTRLTKRATTTFDMLDDVMFEAQIESKTSNSELSPALVDASANKASTTNPPVTVKTTQLPPVKSVWTTFYERSKQSLETIASGPQLVGSIIAHKTEDNVKIIKKNTETLVRTIGQKISDFFELIKGYSIKVINFFLTTIAVIILIMLI